jgi:hypothetical protein
MLSAKHAAAVEINNLLLIGKLSLGLVGSAPRGTASVPHDDSELCHCLVPTHRDQCESARVSELTFTAPVLLRNN